MDIASGFAKERSLICDGDDRAADDETASTRSNTSLLKEDGQCEEDVCFECGACMLPDVAVASNGKKYCDPCWILWGSQACPVATQEQCHAVERSKRQEPQAKAFQENEVQEYMADYNTLEGPPTIYKCTECNVDVPSDAQATADGMKYCDACWSRAIPLQIKRVQPRRGPCAAAWKSAAELRPTFRYAGSLELRPPVLLFDVRDEVCLWTGGFRHGEVVRDSKGREFAAVGVRLAASAPRLWFQPRDLGRPGAGAFPGSGPEVLRTRLRATGGWQRLREAGLAGAEEMEDADGEVMLLCRHCRLPMGDLAYAGDDDGVVHGECLAELTLRQSREADEERLQRSLEAKRKQRAEYGLGWRPERIPDSAKVAERFGCSPKFQGLACVVLDDDAQTASLKETLDPAAAVNLEYLSLALQVRRSQGTEPFFSLDPIPSADGLRHRSQVKRFEPDWIAGTAAGAVMFQADYFLKELSMGEQEQPVVGMKSCLDLSEGGGGGRAWNAREWFVVRRAEVLASQDNVLLPKVVMGVEAREQEETAEGLVDRAVTGASHPLVRYAQAFSRHFDLIAERKSAIFHLRELAKACVLAKFLDDHDTSFEESWFTAVPRSSRGSGAVIPQLWNERCSTHVTVEDGRILEAKEGIRKGKHGVYGGVQFGLEEVVSAGAFRQRKDQRMLPEYMSIRLPQPTRFAPKGVDLNLGKFDLSSPSLAEAEQRSGSWGSCSVGCDAAVGSQFWSLLNGSSDLLPEEDKALLGSIFNPHLSDRRAEKERFLPPDTSASYVSGLRQLVTEERQVQTQRKELFSSTDFQANRPGPLFPLSWSQPFEITRRRASAFAERSQTGVAVSPEELKGLVPTFDKSCEDGSRFRAYQLGDLEVRTIQEEGAGEIVAAVFSTSSSGVQVQRTDGVIKVTEYVCHDAAPFGMFAVLELEQGSTILTELRADGTPSWEMEPVNLQERIAKAKVVRSVDGCGICLGDAEDYRAQYVESKVARRKHFVQGLMNLAGDSKASSFWRNSSESSWQLQQAAGQHLSEDWAAESWETEDWQEEWQRGQQNGPAARCAATKPLASARLPSALRMHFEAVQERARATRDPR